MKAGIYTRVSDDDQVLGFSLQAQLHQLTDFCTKNSLEIYGTYIDEGFSAKYEDEKKRPQFERMLRDAEKKLFNVIVVHKYDRFARNVELSRRVKRQLKTGGVTVISISEPIEDSPVGFLQEGLLELLAEYYVRNLSQEIKKGMRERVSQGLHNGSVPYGYKTDNGNMTINEGQAVIVKKIFEMYNEGMGTSRISNWLYENKIPSAIPGCVWNHHAVLYILKNVKYIGYIRHAGELYKGVHESLIDKEVFDMACRNLTDRTVSREPVGKNETKFMLLGLMRCGVCGRKMGVHVARRYSIKLKKDINYNYYVCSGSRMHENALKCSHRNFYPAAKMEFKVLNQLKNILASRDPLTLKRIDTDYITKNQISKLENEIDRAKTAYLSAVFTLEEYAKIKSDCKNRLLTLKPGIGSNKCRDIKPELKNVLEEIEAETSPAARRLILKRFIKVIRVYPDRIEIEF
jgi:site-specific DNA recombinase